MTALRRVAWVLLVYVVVAMLVLQGGFWLGDVLVLPPLFARLLVGMVALGLPVAIAVAWRYPEIGAPRPVGTAGASGGEVEGDDRSAGARQDGLP